MDFSITYPATDELEEEFVDLETSEDRIQFLIELGQSLPDFPIEFATEEHRVVGCQSMVWIVPDWDGHLLRFMASSDAPMVRGLVAVLMSAYSSKTPEEVIAYPIEAFLGKLHLKSFLSPLRSNGLYSMIRRVREVAESNLPPATTDDANSLPADKSKHRQPLQDLGPLQNRIDSIRADFPILSQKNESGNCIAYLDNAASSQRPQSVIDAISAVYLEHYANVHRSGHEWASKTTEKLEDSRHAVQRYLGAARPEEVIFTAGATASINLIANTWGEANVKAGDEILLTEMEHHSNIVPWQQLCQRKGCVIRWIPIRQDYTLDEAAFAKMLNNKVKLVAMTAVSNVLGTIAPVQRFVNAAHAVGARVLIDAAQAVPHGSFDVQEWDADFVVFSGHKMLASSGVGVCYGKRALLEAMPAWQGGGSMIKSVTWDGFSLADLPHKFEAGTPAIAEIISLKPAIEYLERIGSQRLMEHERMLVGRAMDGLSQVAGVRMYTPALDQKSGVIAFSMDGIHGEEVARVLDGRGVAIRVGHHCAMPLHSKLGVSVTCRASFYLYNTLEEVDRLVEGVAHASRMLKSTRT
jgi:cysteine desulfurase / selenocysteine lyase